MPDHSPLPWKVETLQVVASVDPEDGASQTFVVSGGIAVCQRVHPEDAAFIVRAVNCHAELVRCCEAELNVCRDKLLAFPMGSDATQAKAAILEAILAKAKGEA